MKIVSYEVKYFREISNVEKDNNIMAQKVVKSKKVILCLLVGMTNRFAHPISALPNCRSPNRPVWFPEPYRKGIEYLIKTWH